MHDFDIHGWRAQASTVREQLRISELSSCWDLYLLNLINSDVFEKEREKENL